MSLLEGLPRDVYPKQIFQTIQRYDNFWNKLLYIERLGVLHDLEECLPLLFLECCRLFIRLERNGSNFERENEIKVRVMVDMK